MPAKDAVVQNGAPPSAKRLTPLERSQRSLIDFLFISLTRFRRTVQGAIRTDNRVLQKVMEQDRLDGITTFVAVAEQKSFTAAAARLGVTPSTGGFVEELDCLPES
ncbi:hypothetical protein QFZ94_002199 [Paraburkholderia sp. JPY465]|uniref:LysR family transcriptional regulator n=1 Tax=Paraburkholderia sp. JPY465 TaxID=3042285 RepID=UPI003D22ED04